MEVYLVIGYVKYEGEVLNKVYEWLRLTMETLDDIGLIESHRIDGRKTKLYGGQSDTSPK